MTHRDAISAADTDLSQAVKRVAVAAQTAGLVPSTVQAIVLERAVWGAGDDYQERPVLVEVENMVYRIAPDQERVRASLGRAQRHAQLEAALADRADLLDLLRRVIDDVGDELGEDFTEQVRRFGRIITAHGQADLWREVYQAYSEYGVYNAGDEQRFLLEG